MNILMWILVFIGGTTGALSTLYIIVSLFAVIFYKIYRKVTCHASLYYLGCLRADPALLFGAHVMVGRTITPRRSARSET